MRENAKRRKTVGMVPPRAAPPRVVEMEVNFESFRIHALADISHTEYNTDLRILPHPLVTHDRGFVAFTCRAMASCLTLADSEDFLLAVDAKVGKGPRAWRIATIGFLGKTGLRRTNIKRWNGFRVQGLAYTTSFMPVLQALINEETTENYIALYNLFLDLGSHILGISRDHFARSIRRLAKDFNPGSEAARLSVLDSARPCGDTTHQNARFAIQLPKKCRNTSVQEPSLRSDRPHHEQILEGMRVFCLAAPTIDILDAVLVVAQDFWSTVLGEAEAVKYLTTEKYVERVPREKLQEWKIHVASDTKDAFYFCKAWVGLFANNVPGLECGSQALEAFHSTWERVRNGFGGRDDIMRIMRTMQTLYETDSAFTDLWNDSQRLTLISPSDANPDLLSGDVLRKANLSPAVDYHVADVQHHVILETPAYTVVALQSKHGDGNLPADIPVSVELARFGAEAIHSSDQDLKKCTAQQKKSRQN